MVAAFAPPTVHSEARARTAPSVSCLRLQQLLLLLPLQLACTCLQQKHLLKYVNAAEASSLAVLACLLPSRTFGCDEECDGVMLCGRYAARVSASLPARGGVRPACAQLSAGRVLEGAF